MHVRCLRYSAIAVGAVILCGCLESKSFDDVQENSEDENSAPMAITFLRPSSTFILGSTASVPYSFRSNENEARLLEMNYLGVPRLLRFELTDSGGERVDYRVHFASGPPLPLAPDERFVIAPNETLQLSLRLDQTFQIETAGQYVLSTWYFQQKLAETRIFFAAEPDSDPLVVTECCAHALEFGDGAMLVQCKIRVGPAGTDAPRDSPWILHIEPEVQAGDVPIHPMSSIVIDVRANTKVVTAVLDYRWQLWLLLESGEDQCLIVAPLSICQVRILVPWSEKNVRLGSTRVRSDMNARIALGGVVGEPLHSTERVFAHE